MFRLVLKVISAAVLVLGWSANAQPAVVASYVCQVSAVGANSTGVPPFVWDIIDITSDIEKSVIFNNQLHSIYLSTGAHPTSGKLSLFIYIRNETAKQMLTWGQFSLPSPDDLKDLTLHYPLPGSTFYIQVSCK